jgi:hypothetical protein
MKLLGMGFLMLIVLACVFLPFSQRSGWVGAEVCFVIIFIFFLIFYTNACLSDSDIEISSDSISWFIFNHRWKTIKWKNIDHIRVSYAPDFERHRKVKMYYIFETLRSRAYFLPRGGMFFRETINNSEALEAIIKSKIDEYHIPVVTPSPL